MSIHQPKLISSIEGLGINTTKQMNFLSDTIGIGTEVWGNLEKPWREGDTIIAEPGYKWLTRWEVGKPYVVNKFYDEVGKHIGTYCDVARPVRRIDGGFEFDDLYLDVWQAAGKDPAILDEDELAEALLAGYVTIKEAEEAKLTATKLVQMLIDKDSIFEF